MKSRHHFSNLQNIWILYDRPQRHRSTVRNEVQGIIQGDLPGLTSVMVDTLCFMLGKLRGDKFFSDKKAFDRYRYDCYAKELFIGTNFKVLKLVLELYTSRLFLFFIMAAPTPCIMRCEATPFCRRADLKYFLSSRQFLRDSRVPLGTA
jgi:hypothetical protein